MARKLDNAKTFRLMMVGAVLVGVVAVGAAAYTQRREQIAEAEMTTAIGGAPCPELTTAQVAERGLAPKLTKQHAFNGVTFARRYGHVECGVLGSGEKAGLDYFPVCKFTAPAAVSVTAEGRTTYFDPGAGRAVNVWVRGGKAACGYAASV